MLPHLSRSSLALLSSILLLVLTSGCGGISNPFAAEEPTPIPRPTAAPAAPTAQAKPAAAAAAKPEAAFEPFWVKNYKITGMWSGPTDAPGVVNFGNTTQQFCSFRVVEPPNGPRVYVYNPYSKNYFWIDGDAIGPVGPPERKTGDPPPDQNCADAVYTG
ncbi:MAG: hypothetical protein AB7P40_05455 [Chloroflexota bacterium]